MHDMGQIKRRNVGGISGFTLAEILIALALIGLLAAVILPTVAGQILKGDAARVIQDLDAVRSGVDQFVADVHRYPSGYGQLSTKITTTASDINGNTYPQGLVNKWGGPYVTKDTNASGVVETGFGGNLQKTFIKKTNSNSVDYVTFLVLGIAGPDFDKIDVQVDGSGTSRTTGSLRWATGGGDTTYYLATPIQ